MTSSDGGVELDALQGWIDVYRKASAEKATAEAVMAQARVKIEDALGEAETGTIDGAPVVRWTRVTQRRFDQTLAKERLAPDVLAQCYTESTYRRFTVDGGTP